MTQEKHRKTLATIFFVLGLMQAFGFVVYFFEFGFELMLFLYAVLFLLAGWKLHNQTPGAKVFGIIASLACLPSFPIGTIIGIYGMWYLVMNKREPEV